MGMHELGVSVLLARRAKKLTQASLGKAVGVSHPTIHRIESGAGNVTLELLEKIAAALDTDVAALLQHKDSPSRIAESPGHYGLSDDALRALRADPQLFDEFGRLLFEGKHLARTIARLQIDILRSILDAVRKPGN